MEESIEADSSSADVKYTEMFEKTFPFLLEIGMSYEDFWYNDVEIAKYYIAMWDEKSEREAQQEDRLAWLIGRYVLEAIAGAFDKTAKYPDKPHSYEKVETQETVSLSEEERAELWLRNFDRWANNTK